MIFITNINKTKKYVYLFKSGDKLNQNLYTFKIIKRNNKNFE